MDSVFLLYVIINHEIFKYMDTWADWRYSAHARSYISTAITQTTSFENNAVNSEHKSTFPDRI